jgi:hypothetical protein
MSKQLKAAIAILIGILIVSILYFGVIHPVRYLQEPNPTVSPNAPDKSPMKPDLSNDSTQTQSTR